MNVRADGLLLVVIEFWKGSGRPMGLVDDGLLECVRVCSGRLPLIYMNMSGWKDMYGGRIYH